MIRIFFAFVLWLSWLYSGVNPFVIFNTNHIKSPQSLIPLPQEQSLQKDPLFSDVKVLLLAHESLYISTSAQPHNRINLSFSLDGQLFQKTKLSQNIYGQYVFKNPYSQTLALSLHSPQEINASLYTTANTSVLNTLNPQSIVLGTKPQNVMLPTGASLQRYYAFEENQRFAFDLQDLGTLKLSLRSVLHPIKNLSPYRQSISLRINGQKPYILKAFNGSSLDYLEDANQSPLSADSTHFLPLNKGTNHIEIKANSAILLSANFYHEHIINSKNQSVLTWKIPDSLAYINQAQWKNTSLDAGRRKMFALLKLKENIFDSFQKIQLESMAKKGIFYQKLYPSSFIQEDNLHYFNYANKKLYLQEAYAQRASIHPNYALAHLNSIQEGVFCTLPSSENNEKDIAFERSQEKWYFNSDGLFEDKKLKRQIHTFVQALKPYSLMTLYAPKLPSKGCDYIKSQLIQEGVPKDKIHISKALSPSTSQHQGIEIKVRHHSLKKSYVEYHFDKALEADTLLRLTLFAPKSPKVDLQIQTKEGKKINLHYEKNTPFRSKALSQALLAFELLPNAKENIALLKNKSPQTFLKDTATLSLLFPKGTSSFRIWQKGKGKNKIALSIPKSASYKDSPFALSKQYSQSYKRFARSLTAPMPQHFDPWYEHTHPLRLWLRSQLSQAKVNLSQTALSQTSSLDYAKKLQAHNDRIASMQIAKQGLLASPSAKIQAQAFDLLLSLSQSPQEKLKWFANYFYKTASAHALDSLSTLLEKEGKYSYALDARLLLPSSPSNLRKICDLSLSLNRFVLYDRLCTQNKGLAPSEYLDKKRTLLLGKAYASHASSKAIIVQNAQGIVSLYSPERKQSFPSYKATFAHPLEIQVQGPISLELSMQFDTVHSSYAWLKIEDSHSHYHYPLTQYKASKSLVKMPHKMPVGRSNSLKLQLPAGVHYLRFHAYEVPVLFSLKARKIAPQNILPLSKQIFKTSGYNPLTFPSRKPQNNLAYASALLWNYHYGVEDARHYAQAQAFLLSQETSHIQLRGIYAEVLKYSSFITYTTPQAPLGFYDVPIPTFHPSSKLEKNRLPLLSNIQDYSLILHGADYQIIHLEGEQNFRLEAKQITTKFFPFSPLRFGISCDGQAEKIISINPKTQTWVHDFAIGKSRHSIKLRLLEPLSTQYLAFNMYEDEEKIEQERSKRYFASSPKEPIVLHLEGPKLLRIEEIKADNSYDIRYEFVKKSSKHSLTILPSSSSQESLMRVSYLSFDPLKKVYAQLSVQETLEELWEDEAIDIQQKLPKLKALKSPYKEDNTSLSMPYESYAPTLSIGIRSLHKDLGSEDDINPQTLSVLQLQTSLRIRFSKDLFLRMHYFTNLYQNPLYALEHRLSSTLPLFEDLRLSLDANAYFQTNNHYLFKAFELKAQLYQKKALNNHWSHKYGAGIFKYFLDYDNPSAEVLDPLVYSRYKRDHQQGVYALYQLMYFPYDDLGFSFKSRLSSNEAFSIIDHAKMQVNFYHHFHPFNLKINYDKYYYIEDRNRPKSYSFDKLGASIRFEHFIKNNRLELEATSNYTFSTQNSQLSLSMIWYLSQNKRFYHFAPEEKIFNTLKLRLEDEKD